MITLPLSTIERIVAVHDAAHDRENTSATLTGVLLHHDPEKGMIIAATDGKILIEESYPTESGTLADPFIVSKGSVSQLKDWCKAVRKALPKAREISCTVVKQVGNSVTVNVASCAVGPLTLLGVGGAYPTYGNCFANRQEADKKGNILRYARMAFDSRYLARFDKLWGENGNMAVVIDFRYRAVVFSPLYYRGEGQRRGLILHIALPDLILR